MFDLVKFPKLTMVPRKLSPELVNLSSLFPELATPAGLKRKRIIKYLEQFGPKKSKPNHLLK